MNNSAFIIVLIFSHQMKEVVFVVLAIKHLVKTKRNVQSCGFDINNFDRDYDPNCRTTSCHPYEKQTVQVRELYMVNPCSHEGIDEIMSHVKKCCSVRSDCERKWTILVSDGVPYILASDIQDKFYICNNCNIGEYRKNITNEEFNSVFKSVVKVESRTSHKRRTIFVKAPKHFIVTWARTHRISPAISRKIF